jgi:STAM-binding protein
MTANSQIQETFRDLVDEPDKRFQKFFKFYCDVPYDPSIGLDKYIRSGKELLRMANIYMSEQDFLHAFILYSRHSLLYLETIRNHPAYPKYDKTEIIAIHKQIKTVSLPRAEKLRQYIKESFAQEAKEHAAAKLLQEQTAKPQAAATSSTDLDSLKAKYISENEAELELMKLEAWRHDNEARPPSSSAAVPSAPPSIDRSLKPSTRSASNTYNLRVVSLPAETSRKFLDLAEANTRRNVETCGILAGRLSQNKFYITHCIIPKQTGTSETCSTEQEHELCDIIDTKNLITLGWIHTHPSQTAFLSSVDLHTHFGYQLMIPEAVAIVCAPSFNQYAFRHKFFIIFIFLT